MSSRAPDPTGGERISEIADEFATGFISVWSGFLALALVAILMGVDLALGPFFMYAQADANGIELSLFAKVTPWITSIAMTGLLYALWETLGEEYSQKWIKLLAIALNIGDTLTDFGGANWLFTRNPEAGQNIMWPDGTPPQKIAMIIALGIACFVHEPCLGWLMAKYTNRIDPAAQYGEPGKGEEIEEKLVWLAGVLMNLVKFIGKLGATFMLPLVDLILTPQLVDRHKDPITFWTLCGFSVCASAVQTRLWARIREMGGIRAAIALSTKDAIMVYALGCLVLGDTFFDIRGYNQALYGDPGNFLDVIPNPTQNWAITIFILVPLCSMGEMLSREIFTILSRKARAKRTGAGSPGGMSGGMFGGGRLAGTMRGMFGGGHGGPTPGLAGGMGDGPGPAPGHGGFGLGGGHLPDSGHQDWGGGIGPM